MSWEMGELPIEVTYHDVDTNELFPQWSKFKFVSPTTIENQVRTLEAMTVLKKWACRVAKSYKPKA